MDLEVLDQSKYAQVCQAMESRALFELKGAGVEAYFLAQSINRDYRSGCISVELVQVFDRDDKCEKPQNEPAPWNGKGRPPVGTMCEFLHLGVKDWVAVTVYAYPGNTHLLGVTDSPLWESNNGACRINLDGCKFRPVRTAEQIAAEKRGRDAEDLAETMSGHRDRSKDCYLTLAKVVLDAGYRKVDQ